MRKIQPILPSFPSSFPTTKTKLEQELSRMARFKCGHVPRELVLSPLSKEVIYRKETHTVGNTEEMGQMDTGRDGQD